MSDRDGTMPYQASSEDTTIIQADDNANPHRYIACIEEPLDVLLRSNPDLRVRVHPRYKPEKSADSSVAGSNQSVASGFVATSHPTEDLTNFVVQTSTETENQHAKEKTRDKHLQLIIRELKDHIDKSLENAREQSRGDIENVLVALLQESGKRTAAEGRLNAHLFLLSETMVAMELKLLRLEAKVEGREAAQRTRRIPTIGEIPRQQPPNIISSTASMASGVTQPSMLGDLEDYFDEKDEQTGHDDSVSDSTPPQGSRPIIAGVSLDEILLSPMIGETDATSTRATRGGGDANSSMATSVTSSTLASTTVTARGTSTAGEENRSTRSRSQSPLTVQSFQGGDGDHPVSVAGSIGASIVTNAAVAPGSRFTSRPRSALSNRVVSFEVDMANPQAQIANEAGDSITMPDELDNLSEVAESFSTNSRLWREEYEARLDALQKRLNAGE